MHFRRNKVGYNVPQRTIQHGRVVRWRHVIDCAVGFDILYRYSQATNAPYRLAFRTPFHSVYTQHFITKSEPQRTQRNREIP